MADSRLYIQYGDDKNSRVLLAKKLGTWYSSINSEKLDYFLDKYLNCNYELVESNDVQNIRVVEE